MVILLLIGLLFMKNGLYLFICFLTCLIIVSRLWKPYRPAILFFCFSMQWIQIVTYVLWLNSLDVKIDEKHPMIPYAIIEALMGLLLMVFTVGLATRRQAAVNFEQILADAKKWDTRKLLILYGLSTVFLSSLGVVFPDMRSGVTQVLMTLQDIKWVFLMVYGIVIWTKRESKTIFWLICLYEFGISFYSYFSDFKMVIFIVLIILLGFISELSYKRAMSVFFVGLLLAFVLVTWTAIKGEYRNFLSSGKRIQKVYVSKNEAFKNITYQIGRLDFEKYELAYESSLYRLQYLLHLNRVMMRIPAFAPHENGNLWKSNIEYVLTPRVFFPDKKVFDPSVKTNKYTGYRYATGRSGVSFSLGYFSESYVDFGHFWMFVPLVLIALYTSVIFNIIMNLRSLNLLLRYGIVSIVLLVFITIEADGIFLIGRLTINFLVMLFLSYTLFPAIQKWASTIQRKEDT